MHCQNSKFGVHFTNYSNPLKELCSVSLYFLKGHHCIHVGWSLSCLFLFPKRVKFWTLFGSSEPIFLMEETPGIELIWFPMIAKPSNGLTTVWRSCSLCFPSSLTMCSTLALHSSHSSSTSFFKRTALSESFSCSCISYSSFWHAKRKKIISSYKSLKPQSSPLNSIFPFALLLPFLLFSITT